MAEGKETLPIDVKQALDMLLSLFSKAVLFKVPLIIPTEGNMQKKSIEQLVIQLRLLVRIWCD